MLEHTYDAGICVMTKINNLIGGKWKPIILYLIQHDINRFGVLKKSMPRISKKVLTNQLRELEQDNLIHRDVQVASAPQIVVYSLTLKGVSLRHLLDKMVDWGMDYFKDDYSDVQLAKFETFRQASSGRSEIDKQGPFNPLILL